MSLKKEITQEIEHWVKKLVTGIWHNAKIDIPIAKARIKSLKRDLRSVDLCFQRLEKKKLMFCFECSELNERPHYKHNTTEQWIRFSDVEAELK